MSTFGGGVIEGSGVASTFGSATTCRLPCGDCYTIAWKGLRLAELPSMPTSTCASPLGVPVLSVLYSSEHLDAPFLSIPFTLARLMTIDRSKLAEVMCDDKESRSEVGTIRVNRYDSNPTDNGRHPPTGPLLLLLRLGHSVFARVLVCCRPQVLTWSGAHGPTASSANVLGRPLIQDQRKMSTGKTCRSSMFVLSTVCSAASLLPWQAPCPTLT